MSEVASPRTVARTLAIFFAFGGAAGLLILTGVEPGTPRTVLVGLDLLALVAAVVVGWWGPRWRRECFHIPVAAATVLITTATLLAPDPVTSLAAALLIVFVVVDAHFFFSGGQALAHLVVALLGVTVALHLTQGISLGVALGLDLALTGLGVVIRRLVMLAATAARDPLTGLRNRRGFDQSLDELMALASRTGEPLSAVLIDVDHFKAVNDTSGHEAGDKVLRRIADVWPAELPDRAVLARHGGDEFSLLLPGLRGREALALVRRVCALHPDVSLSCGVAQYRRGDSASQLMRSADRALYDAKVAGRGRARLFDGSGSAPVVTG